MAGSLQFRILGQVLPHDSKLQTAGHQTFNPGLGAWEALIFLENQWKSKALPGRIITMMSSWKRSENGLAVRIFDVGKKEE